MIGCNHNFFERIHIMIAYAYVTCKESVLTSKMLPGALYISHAALIGIQIRADITTIHPIARAQGGKAPLYSGSDQFIKLNIRTNCIKSGRNNDSLQ